MRLYQSGLFHHLGTGQPNPGVVRKGLTLGLFIQGRFSRWTFIYLTTRYVQLLSNHWQGSCYQASKSFHKHRHLPHKVSGLRRFRSVRGVWQEELVSWLQVVTQGTGPNTHVWCGLFSTGKGYKYYHYIYIYYIDGLLGNCQTMSNVLIKIHNFCHHAHTWCWFVIFGYKQMGNSKHLVHVCSCFLFHMCLLSFGVWFVLVCCVSTWRIRLLFVWVFDLWSIRFVSVWRRCAWSFGTVPLMKLTVLTSRWWADAVEEGWPMICDANIW